MRNKVRKSLAFLLALALVVSVMSGLGLSVSAEQKSNTPGTEEVQQQDKTEAGVAPSEVKAEEEAAKPEEKPVQEETKDEQKKQEETKTDDAAKDDANAQDGNQKDEPQAEPAAEEQDAPVEEAVDEQALPTADAPRATMSNDIVIPEPSYEKKAEYSGQDDVYDLSLSVSGSVASQAEKSPVDIVLILDESNSMVDGENGENRWTDTKKAANALINALDQNKDLNVRYDIVGFDGYGNGKLDEDARSSGWKTTADSAKKAIPEKLVERWDGGGTDYQAGIRQAINDLKNARVGAQTVVVFLSDGAPTFRLTARDQYEGILFPYNYRYGNGNDDDNEYNIEGAVKEIANMHVSQFYAIGLGADFNKANSTAKANLIKLNNAVNAAVKADDVYTTKNSSGLEAIFKAIAGRVNNIACKDVKITDNINTQYAQVVTQTNGNPTKLTITVKKADGTVVKSGENSITLGATELNKESSVLNATYQKNQLVLNFPDNYQLEDGWTYTITTQVKPTQAAYEYYSDNNGSYPNSGDANTGTHSGERGFWSNTSAVLDYTVSGTGKHATYAQPVIQVKAGTLKITKNISGLTPDQIASMKDDMTFTIKKDNKPYKTIRLSAFDLKDRTYTYEMPYCVPGATYTVTESGMDVDDFDCVTTVNGTSGVTSGGATIVKGGTKTIAFTNVYTPSTQDLTITKEIWVDGAPYTGAEFNNAEYTFTVHGEKLDEDRTVTVRGARSETIKNLPVGSYTITETSHANEPAKYEFKGTDRPQEITLSKENHAVTITNKYDTKKYKVYVRKELDGNMYDSSDKFSFTVDGKDGTLTLGKDQTSGAYEVTYGDSFTVKETDDKGYTSTTAKAYKATVNNDGTVSKGEEVNGTYTDDAKSYTLSNITEDIIIVFTNTKTIQPPNGIITTIAPYAIMVVLAASAGVYFVYSRRRRNR